MMENRDILVICYDDGQNYIGDNNVFILSKLMSDPINSMLYCETDDDCNNQD
jgi:hypothetical protein